jgi:DNA-binding response OmpR family regulator
MPRRRIVVVIEDEDAIRRGIVDVLRMAGYEPIEAADGEIGLIEARRAGVDLILLDLMLPKLDGFEVLTELRKTHPSLPVIILSARGAEDDRVQGLRGGADDYVIKPFSARELLARVEAVLRRSPERILPPTRISIGGTFVDCARREIHLEDGSLVSISDMEARILERLAAHKGRSVSREELLSCVWGIRDGMVETRAIDMHITRLRSKLSTQAKEKPLDWIITVRGKGYMLGPDVEVSTESVETERAE